VDIGIVIFGGSAGLTPQALGRAAEERGFESLFFPEHTHIPVSTTRPDGSSGRDFADTYAPFIALAAAAAVTDRLKLGTAVCLVPQHDPIVLAKEVASLDRLSGGRLLLGVGAGWNRPELAHHGVDPRARMAVLADRVRAMRALWTAETAEYHGEHVSFGPSWSWPKPVQQPHPPVLVGGNGPGTEDRVLDYGDGWLPQAGPLASVAELESRIAALQRRAAAAGRGPLPVTVFAPPPQPPLLAALAAAGASRCLLAVRNDAAARVLTRLDEWVPLLQAS
jgi:probable F420-dependent oxidoreductase